MTIPSVSYGLYAPTQLKVISLGVGIGDDTNSNLDLRNQQALIVAERLQSVSGESDRKTYGLIVDNEGIAINTSLVSRAAHSNLYHLYVDGDVRVKGNMVVDGILYGRDGSNLFAQVGSYGSSSDNANYWVMSDDNYFNNIYFAGTATLGNNSAASNNNFVLNIVSSAHGDVDQSHISLQNLNAAQLRLGVIGTAPNAPIVFNTNAITNADGELGGAIEFHVGRDNDYFHQIYYGTNSWGDVPEYTDMPVYMAPHMKIDERGNVGIHTSANRAISFNLRQFATDTQSISYNPKYESVALHVEGYTYSCNVIIWDYESGKTCNIDDLYVRKLGVALPANQVIPGTFANGNYTFPRNVTVDRDITTDSAHVNKLIVDDAIINTSMFYDDAVFNHDIIANQSLRIRGQIYTEVLSNVEIDGTSNYAFQMIQWTPASPSLTNINLIGQGISTPGRLGVGVNPNAYNPVNGQVSVYKVDPNIWELELYDKSSNIYRSRAAFIGHPRVDGTVNNGIDGSLVIATPSRTDPNYAGRYSEFPQNIYFYPGADMSAEAQASAFIRLGVKPTLGVFNIKKTESTDLHAVGINTYNPSTELDVIGSITFSGDLIYSPPNANPVNVGIWRQTTYADVKVNYQNYFNGISYVSPLNNGAHVGINTIPDSTYGLVIAGISRFNDGIYIPDTNNVDRKMGVWMDNRDTFTVTNNIAPGTRSLAGDVFTWSGVGVGVKNPNANVEIKNNYSVTAFSNIGTSLQLTQGSIPLSSIIYQGNTTNDVWKMQVVHESSAFASSIFQMGFGTNAFTASNVKRYLWMKPPNPLSGILSSNISSSLHPQVVIGADLNVFSNSSNTDPSAYLTVGGNVSVLGDVSISGQFKMKGLVVQNDSIVSEEQQVIPNLQSDDVYISGGHVQLNPSSGKTIILGNPRPITGATTLDPIIDNDNAQLRVYAPYGINSMGVIAAFLTNDNNALIKLSTGNNNKLLFGAVDAGSAAYANTPFVFMNENNKVYMSFYQSAVTGTEFFVGVGVPLGQNVGSKMHIYSSGTGENMLRLTKAVYDNDTTADAPQIDLQKNYQYSISPNSLSSTRQASITWTMKGAIASWNQKLSFIHKTPTYPGNSYSTDQTTYEPFCITPQGCIGIGNTQPEFAVDILNTANIGGLRIRNTGSNASPHIVLQSGESTFGSDSNIDYRITSSNNRFRVESQDNVIGLKTIMDVSKDNKVGICGLATSEYDITLYGSVNVTSGFSIGGASIQSFVNNSLSIESVNVFLTPDRTQNGSIVINNPSAASGTGNLMHIFSGNSGNNSMNMMVYDSDYNQAQVHYRTQEVNADSTLNGYYNMYRTGMGGNSFYWKYYPRCGKAFNVPDNDVGYSNVMNIAPTSRRTAAEYDLTVNGSIVSSSTVNPGVYLGTMGAVGASNGHVYINAYGTTGASNGNVGIGTFVPQNRLHVYGSNTGAAVVRIEQNGTGDVLALYGSNTVNPLFNVSAAGVSVGRRFYADYGSAALPSFSFASKPNDTSNIYSGLYLTTSNAVAVSMSGIERMRVERSGIVNIGGGGPGLSRQFAGLSIVSSNVNTGIPALNIVQYGRDNIITMVGYTGMSNVVSAIGNVGIGTTNPSSNLHVVGTILIEGLAQFNQDLDINGNMYVDGNAYVAGNEITGLMNTNTSDRRLKKDFEKITHALDKVKSLTGYTFARVEEKYGNKRFTGLMAQDVAEVLPEAVVEYSETAQEEKYLSLAYGNMMGLIVEAIKELSDEVASLRQLIHTNVDK